MNDQERERYTRWLIEWSIRIEWEAAALDCIVDLTEATKSAMEEWKQLEVEDGE